jgi:hypothetical protein
VQRSRRRERQGCPSGKGKRATEDAWQHDAGPRRGVALTMPTTPDRVPFTSPLREPSASIPSSETVTSGPPVPAMARLKLFDSSEWEEVVLEWADSLKGYDSVEKYGGANDLGCDVVAYLSGGAGTWDNYQCKHYDHALTPSDAWPEIAKLLIHTQRGELRAPEHYLFVAPRGAGTKLAKLLREPEALRNAVLDAWEKDGGKRVAVALDEDLRAHLASFDFSMFSALPPLRLLDGHARTRWHVARFGSGLPPRPPISSPPVTPATQEAVYVGALLQAYGEHLGQEVPSVQALTRDASLTAHFNDARIAFYSAEGLRLFSRDTLPPTSYTALQDDVHAGIKIDLTDEHPDGYARVRAATKTAQVLALGAHPLAKSATVVDRHGICHQLANDGKVKWTT